MYVFELGLAAPTDGKYVGEAIDVPDDVGTAGAEDGYDIEPDTGGSDPAVVAITDPLCTLDNADVDDAAAGDPLGGAEGGSICIAGGTVDGSVEAAGAAYSGGGVDAGNVVKEGSFVKFFLCRSTSEDFVAAVDGSLAVLLEDGLLCGGTYGGAPFPLSPLPLSPGPLGRPACSPL